MRLISSMTAIALATLTFTATPSLADSHADSIKQELSAYNDAYNQIIETYDLEAFIGLYNDAPLWIAPKEAPVAGLDVPRGTFGFIIEKEGKLTHTFDELVVSDDGSQAVMIGTYDLNIEQVGAKATGTYLFVLEREGEGWNIVVDMFNEHVAK